MPYWGKLAAPFNGACLVRLWWRTSPKHQSHPFPMPQLQHNIKQQGVVRVGGHPVNTQTTTHKKPLSESLLEFLQKNKKEGTLEGLLEEFKVRGKTEPPPNT